MARYRVFEYMDDISEIVYVADIETHELLYLNDSGRRLFGVEDIAGRTCHAVLQGSNTPCCFCTNTRLRHEENYTWERINPLTNHRYLLKDRLIDWQGRTARLEVAFDMTASSNGQADFRIALDAESMVLQCARDLNAAHELASATDGMLRRLGAFLRADRAHMFGVRGDRIFGVREWCAIGGPSRLRNLETIKEATLRRWERFFSRGECVVIDDIEELREAQPVEYAFLKDHGIDAVAAVALGRLSGVSGFLVIENPQKSLIKNTRSSLQTLCYFYMSTVHRIENEKKLTLLSFHDALTGLYNRNRYMSDIAFLGAREGSLGVVFMDVNDLKLVNDRYGHGRGDEALRICAAKMRAALGGADLYRIGGDEFVALAVDVEEDVFVAMVDRLEQTLKVEEDEAGLFVSVGARWSPDCSSVEALLTAADQDMYEKKRSFHAERALANALPYEDADRLGREALEDDIVRARESALLREYNMLMSALHVSVSKHLFTERFEVVWANDYYYAMTGYTREEYEDLFDNCCAAYFASEPDEYTALSKAVVEAYEAGEPGYELLMHMPCKGGVYTWIRVVGMFTNEIIDGAPVIYATFVNVDDVVQMERERSITYDNIPGFVARYRVARDGLMLLPVSVNLSRMHLRDPRFLDRFEAIRIAHGVPAALIEFELTETLVFEDPQMLSGVIDRIHQAGYTCSMDDFGSGYSSLNVLKNLEVDVLKLDRVFFDASEAGDARATDIIAVVIELAKRLGMKTVAEGVETEAQRRFLAEEGCDMIQGFLFSRPVPPDEFEHRAFGRSCDDARSELS